MPTIVGILTFMSRKIFMLNSVEHEKSFITSAPDQSSFFAYLILIQGYLKKKKESSKDYAQFCHI